MTNRHELSMGVTAQTHQGQYRAMGDLLVRLSRKRREFSRALEIDPTTDRREVHSGDSVGGCCAVMIFEPNSNFNREVLVRFFKRSVVSIACWGFLICGFSIVRFIVDDKGRQ
jgi:hypothetical protein